MAYIGRGTENISNVEVLDNLTFDGSASYTLQKSSTNFVPSSANNLLISISGVVQQGNFSVSGSTITFDTTVASSDTCDWILHYGTGLITTPADGTVTNDKISYPLVKSGATVSTFNRTTSDGDIITIQKDGTTVGTIYNGGSNLGVNSSGGLLLVDDIITPTSGADNTKDIGRSSARWKDLYLGGNIYLGGTGSANALDDYEEGTWSPQYTATGGSITATTTAHASYVKVGNMVYIQCKVATYQSSLTGDLSITGLPFTASNVSNKHNAFAVYRYYYWNTDMPNITAGCDPNTSVIRLFKNATNATSRSRVQGSDTANGVNQSNIVISGCYQVD